MNNDPKTRRDMQRDEREVQLADCIIRILDTTEALGLDVAGTMIEKTASTPSARIKRWRSAHLVESDSEMRKLPSRTSTSTDAMPLDELIRPLSAKALSRSAMVGKYGERLSEDEARARTHELFNNRRNGRRGVSIR